MITQQKYVLPISLLVAFIFQALFFEHSAGLNYLIFSLLVFGLTYGFLQPTNQSNTFRFIQILAIVSTVAVLMANTTYSLYIYWLFTVLFVSVACYSRIKHVQIAPLFLWTGIKASIDTFKGNRETGWLKKITPFIKFIFLPIFTILVLMFIYSAANPMFFESIENALEWMAHFLEKISFPRVFTALIGLILTLILLQNKVSQAAANFENSISFDLIRAKNKALKYFGLTKMLQRKHQVALFTFFALNVMIAWLNYLDIKNIWIDFKWDGGLLRQMVHVGTNMLIVAIFISIGITLFYLNSNIVFLKNNKLFIALVLLWLGQNVVMSCSVFIRNAIYIEHFSLAYLRIFLYFFLTACVVGLMSIAYKIIFQRSNHFLYSVNCVSVMMLLAIAACFNWDKIIARNNFEHYKKSFVHYRFLSELNNSALPYLLKTKQELGDIYNTQAEKFPFVKAREYEQINYESVIEINRSNFIKHWESKSILEWNYAEYTAYNALVNKD